jgi:hypothetical protein
MNHIYIPNRFTCFHQATLNLMALDSVAIKSRKINLTPKQYLLIHAIKESRKMALKEHGLSPSELLECVERYLSTVSHLFQRDGKILK